MNGERRKCHASEQRRRIVVHGHRTGEPDRDAEVLELREADGGPPYLVRWGHGGHETIFFPGSEPRSSTSEHSSQ